MPQCLLAYRSLSPLLKIREIAKIQIGIPSLRLGPIQVPPETMERQHVGAKGLTYRGRVQRGSPAEVFVLQPCSKHPHPDTGCCFSRETSEGTLLPRVSSTRYFGGRDDIDERVRADGAPAESYEGEGLKDKHHHHFWGT